MSEPTIEQRRASAAWSAVTKDVKGQGFAGEYSTLAKGAPADIQTNGLGQTLAFWFARRNKEPAHATLFAHVSSWVLPQVDPGATDGDLLAWICRVDSEQYRWATVEALAYLGWIKRFAEGELSDG